MSPRIIHRPRSSARHLIFATKFCKRTALLCLTFSLNCCILAHNDNPIPGEERRHTDPDGVPFSTILVAIKEQVAGAQQDIANLKAANPRSAINGLNLEKGNCTLTATVKTETDNSGSLTTVIPFSGYNYLPNGSAATTTTPNIGGELNASSSRLVTFNFSLDPSRKLQGSRNETRPLSSRGHMDDTIRDAIYRQFKDILDTEQKSAGMAGPPVAPISMDFKFTFVALKKLSGGWQISFLPFHTESISSVTPSLSASRSQTQTHELAISLPFNIPDPGDKREIIVAVDRDKRFYIKKPYSDKAWASITKKLEQEGDPINMPSARERMLLEKGIPYRLESSGKSQKDPIIFDESNDDPTSF